MPFSKEILDQLALSPEEYDLLVKRLGREPNYVELGLFGGLWNEHCGYKNSKPLLRLFPTRGKRVLVRAGEENAGVVDLGDGLVAVMKIESHNHPSAIEPYQGAATGVGGIVRDIFAMGARPIALFNSLRFGPLTEPRNRYLFGGVVAGIAGYGNCLGIPDVAGEVYFEPAYTHNPLVNALCLGIAERKHLLRSHATGEGNLLLLVGADTGRDGIHGSSGLASRTFEEERELRPTVQVGNPFLEKLLIEACLEIAREEGVVGLQDLGASGLTAATVEAASRGGSGFEIDILRVPRREEGMTPYEVMLSESQERMLVIVRPGYEERIKAVFQKWDLLATVIGQVTGDGLARVKEGDMVAAEVPVALLTDPPFYRRPAPRPAYLKRLHSYDLSSLLDLEGPGVEMLLKLLSSPNLASKEWVYRQYDHQVLTNTVAGPGGDAAILRLKETRKALALTGDGNGRLCYLDPYVGGARAVAEAARNLACVGAEPIALTDCLNFGAPERPEVYYQFKHTIQGMARACRVLAVPVISGNVSFYNETQGQAVYPTPVVGMLGLLEEVEKRCDIAFKGEGDVVYLLGQTRSLLSSLAGSEYLLLAHGLVVGKPEIDLELERRVQRCCREAIRAGLLRSAHDCSEGGLAVALAESALAGNLGFRGEGASEGRRDVALFGEAPSRIVVSVVPRHEAALKRMAQKHGVPLQRLGKVGGGDFTLGRGDSLPLEQLKRAWERALRDIMA